MLSKEIRYNRLAALATLPGFGTRHLTTASRAQIGPPWPELVISAGRRAAPVALAIKRYSPGTQLVQLMWPGKSPHTFELITLPEQDMQKRQGTNVLRTSGAPHSITSELLAAQAALWHQRVARLPRPYIGLFIGGSRKGAEWDDADFKTLAAYASAEVERFGGSLLIASGPRTSASGEALVKSLLTVPYLFHAWDSPEDNPSTAFLGLSDAVIATGDSISMCSQACATGKPVYIFTPPHLNNGKNAFLDSLYTRGHAKAHTYPIRLDWQPQPLPDAATEVANAIQTRLFHTGAA